MFFTLAFRAGLLSPARVAILLCGSVLLAAGLTAPRAAAAAVIHVNTTLDSTAPASKCTLREAIRSANTDTAVGNCTAGNATDTVVLPAGRFILDTPGTAEDAAINGDLDFTADAVVRGAGAGRTIINAGGASGLGERVFHLTLPNEPAVTIRDLTITGGYEDPTVAGGINVRGDLTLIRVEVRGNDSTSAGGGIQSNGGSVTIQDSTISGNDAQNGGGISAGFGVALTLVNTTISGNRATVDGGGLNINGEATGTHVTIVANRADSDSDNAGQGGGVGGSGGVAHLEGSIVGGNLDNSPGGGNAPDCSVTLNLNGGNVVQSTTGCTIQTPEANDETNVSPGIAPTLTRNGGPTKTHALTRTGEARNLVGAADCAAVDQRGAPRGRGTCDSGAYEYVACSGVLVNRVGTSGSDLLTGTAGKDGFLALGGRDTARGKGGNDALCLGDGRDKGIGGDGNDTILGQAGNDSMNGGPGRADVCIQGPGTGPARGCELR